MGCGFESHRAYHLHRREYSLLHHGGTLGDARTALPGDRGEELEDSAAALRVAEGYDVSLDDAIAI
jgi:hypothetical protein